MIVTLGALSLFPQQLEATYSAVPVESRNYSPASWDGTPSERFTPIEHLCHVRDIEVFGYRIRFQRILDEPNPTLASIDGEALAQERSYAKANAAEVLAAFRAARKQTLELIAAVTPQQLARTAVFGDYGRVTLRSLVHFLCSHDQQHLAGLHWLLGKIEADRKS